MELTCTLKDNLESIVTPPRYLVELTEMILWLSKVYLGYLSVTVKTMHLSNV